MWFCSVWSIPLSSTHCHQWRRGRGHCVQSKKNGFIHPSNIHPSSSMAYAWLTYSFGGKRTLIKRSLWHCGVKASLPPEELGVATPEELPGTWCRTCERASGWPPWVLMVGRSKNKFWLWTTMLPLGAIDLRNTMVQHRGARIHSGTYTWDSFPSAGSRPLVVQIPGLVLCSVLTKSHSKPIRWNHFGGPISLEYLINPTVWVEGQRTPWSGTAGL